MSPPRLLVCEGNTAELRAKQVTAGGQIMSDGYADLLRRLLPGAVVDICYPADPGANLPIGGLEGYDGVAITGSALNVYDGGPQIAQQIELAREVLKAKDAAVRKLLGPAGDHGRGRRHGAGQSEGPRDRDRAAHRAHARGPRASDVSGQGLRVRCRHGASRRGRDSGARHDRAGDERPLRRAGGRDQGRRRGRLGACSIIPNSRSATWRRSCAAMARG